MFAVLYERYTLDTLDAFKRLIYLIFMISLFKKIKLPSHMESNFYVSLYYCHYNCYYCAGNRSATQHNYLFLHLCIKLGNTFVHMCL